MKINRELFYAAYRDEFGSLEQSQVDGINAILLAIEADSAFAYPPDAQLIKRKFVSQVAYILATIKHECADEWHPIDEYGKGAGRAYGKPDPRTGKTYYGRGFVQLTWYDNYRKMGAKLNVDLLNKPELAKDPAIAWQITSLGMREGIFTSKKLNDYITESTSDFLNARRIINRLDKARLIAGYAEQFKIILNASVVE